MNDYERLLREFIAALNTPHDIWLEELKHDDSNDEAAACDYVHGLDINSYHVGSKLSEMKDKLMSLPL